MYGFHKYCFDLFLKTITSPEFVTSASKSLFFFCLPPNICFLNDLKYDVCIIMTSSEDVLWLDILIFLYKMTDGYFVWIECCFGFTNISSLQVLHIRTENQFCFLQFDVVNVLIFICVTVLTNWFSMVAT